MITQPSDAEARNWVSHVLLTRGLVVLVLGVVAMLWPDVTVKVVAVLVGIVVLIFGLGIVGHALHRRSVGWSWIPSLLAGLIVAGFGAAAIIWPGPTVLVLARLFGVALIISGFLTVLDIYTSKGDDPSWMPMAGMGVLSVLFGVLLVSWPDITIGVLVVIQGIFWVISGILSVVASRQVKDLPA
jgi:uncharacterized membrane protein HdeD (DUF308 family)